MVFCLHVHPTCPQREESSGDAGSNAPMPENFRLPLPWVLWAQGDRGPKLGCHLVGAEHALSSRLGEEQQLAPSSSGSRASRASTSGIAVGNLRIASALLPPRVVDVARRSSETGPRRPGRTCAGGRDARGLGGYPARQPAAAAVGQRVQL